MTKKHTIIAKIVGDLHPTFELQIAKQKTKAVVVKCLGLECERIHEPSGFPFIYHIRHSDTDPDMPTSIEPKVRVNHYGIIFTEKELKFPKEDPYLPISQKLRRQIQQIAETSDRHHQETDGYDGVEMKLTPEQRKRLEKDIAEGNIEIAVRTVVYYNKSLYVEENCDFVDLLPNDAETPDAILDEGDTSYRYDGCEFDHLEEFMAYYFEKEDKDEAESSTPEDEGETNAEGDYGDASSKLWKLVKKAHQTKASLKQMSTNGDEDELGRILDVLLPRWADVPVKSRINPNWDEEQYNEYAQSYREKIKHLLLVKDK